MPSTTKTTRIAISGYKNSRKSHVGIHLWAAPSSTTNNSKKRKQVMIVHIDDHSIFASSATTKKVSSSVPQPATLKVGMKLISVNGINIRQQHSIQDIYAMLQNAVGCVTLLVGTPTIATNTTTTSAFYPENDAQEKLLSSATSWVRQHDYDRIPNMESLTIHDAYESSSASSSFSSSSSSASTMSPFYPLHWNVPNDIDSDDDDDDESIIQNVYALENTIRSIWSPILTNGNISISNRKC